jgi:ComF family protein
MRSLFHNEQSHIRSITKFLLDGFFPIRCIGCGVYDEWICAHCHTRLPLITEQDCPLCKKHATKNGEKCFSCGFDNNGFDSVFVVSHYHDPIIKTALHYFKYRFVKELAHPLALLCAQALQHSHIPIPDMIIPVPLHSRRLRWRGFNQSEILAHALDLRIPVITDILVRVRYTKPQVRTKSKNERTENLRDAFDVTPHTNINGKDILLIDDIMTTGTTLHECATKLKCAGARKVHCLVLARE